VVCIDWEDESRSACFELEWLAAHAFGGGEREPSWRRGRGSKAASSCTRDFAWASLAAAREDSRARLTWLTRLLQDGLAFLSGVPAQETALLEAMLWSGACSRPTTA